MAETTRSVRPIPLSDNRQPADETEVQVGSVGILFDNDGALWITSVGDGLRRSPDPELLKGKIKEFSTAVDSFTTKDGLSDDVVRAVLQDREGAFAADINIGIMTADGITADDDPLNQQMGVTHQNIAVLEGGRFRFI